MPSSWPYSCAYAVLWCGSFSQKSAALFPPGPSFPAKYWSSSQHVNTSSPWLLSTVPGWLHCHPNISVRDAHMGPLYSENEDLKRSDFGLLYTRNRVGFSHSSFPSFRSFLCNFIWKFVNKNIIPLGFLVRKIQKRKINQQRKISFRGCSLKKKLC